MKVIRKRPAGIGKFRRACVKIEPHELSSPYARWTLNRSSRLARILVLGALFAALAIAIIWSPSSGVTDFAAYWTGGQRLIHRQDPYSQSAVLALERQLGFTGTIPLVIRNPPWALPLTLPLGLLPYDLAQRLWLWIGIAITLVCAHWLWQFYAPTNKSSFAVLVITVLYLPAATVLALGQIGPLVLLGIVGFLICAEKRFDGWAGVSAFLIALKPHLALFFWPVLLWWVIENRRLRILYALALALLAATAIALAFDPHAFSHYSQLWRESNLVWYKAPTAGGVLCRWLAPRKSWLVATPTVLGGVWLLWLWLRERRGWEWRAQMPALLLVSVWASPYAWFFDQVVLLPALVELTTRTQAASVQKRIRVLILFLAINATVLLFLLAHRTAFWYAWTASAWLLLYLFGRWQLSTHSADSH